MEKDYQKEYWFFKGFKASEKYQEENGAKQLLKDDITNSGLEVAWTEYCPMMLANYLDETDSVPKEYYDDYIDGIELSQDKNIFHAYLELKGVKEEKTGIHKEIKKALDRGELTILEAKVMNYLMTDGYYAEYMFSDLTVEDISNAINKDTKTTRGVIGSLVKKKYLWVSEREGEIPPIVYATKAGYMLSDEWESRWKEQAGDSIY
jgi:DNA-binding MarR family transcriptional regulator